MCLLYGKICVKKDAQAWGSGPVDLQPYLLMEGSSFPIIFYMAGEGVDLYLPLIFYKTQNNSLTMLSILVCIYLKCYSMYTFVLNLCLNMKHIFTKYQNAQKEGFYEIII